MTPLNYLLLAITACGVAIVAMVRYGAARWGKRTAALLADLERGRIPLDVPRFSVTSLAGLPAPVERYFRAALRDGQPVVAAVSLTHSGTFNPSESGEKWIRFTSTQRVITRRPGFVWDARMDIVPGVSVRVHDAYVAGEGFLHPAVLGIFSLATLRGRGRVAEGELMRFIAEAAWYPTALLPSQGVHWEPVSGHSARATLTDGDLRLTLTFGFGPDSLIETVRADARGRTVGEEIVMTPWQGHFWNYAERGGMRVPLDGKVAWLLPGGPRPYWRGHVERLEYEMAL